MGRPRKNFETKEAEDADLDGFGEDPDTDVEEADPALAADPLSDSDQDSVVKKATAAKPNSVVAVKPRRAWILDKFGKKQAHPDDPKQFLEYEPSQHHLHVGFVNANGVLFPTGFKFRGGHVSWRDVVLNRCPKCGHKQSIDEAVQGECQNMKAPPDGNPCGYSSYEELNSYAIE